MPFLLDDLTPSIPDEESEFAARFADESIREVKEMLFGRFGLGS